jgi:hypothetical protein
MKNDNTKEQRARHILRMAAVTALGAAFTFARPSIAHAQTVNPPPVPTDVEVLAPNEAFLVGHAVGTQNYVCAPSSSIGHVAWTLFTPEATLFSDEGEQLTTHFFSPNPAENQLVRATWQDSRDSSTVWARVTGSSTDPTFVAAGAIPWLRLEAAGTQVGPTGGSTLARTTFVQRLNTIGGAAPSTGCELPTDLGRKAFVPYTADYFFYTR